MPIYDFKCQRCGHLFEQLVKPDEIPRCPSCDAARTQRQFSYSAAVATTRTRASALAVERGKARAVKKEKDSAHAEYMRNHIKDHS